MLKKLSHLQYDTRLLFQSPLSIFLITRCLCRTVATEDAKSVHADVVLRDQLEERTAI